MTDERERRDRRERDELLMEHLERIVKAEMAAASAHHRLDGYNGQIARLGTEVANVRIDLAGLRVKTATMAAIGAAIGTAVVGGIVAAVLFALGLHS